MTPSKSVSIRLHPDDNVVVVSVPLTAGDKVLEEGIQCRASIPEGHKMATESIGKGKIIRKYGQVIGVATRDILAGEHVHTHNMGMVHYERDYAFSGQSRQTVFTPEKERASFQGIIREDGRFATRNYIGVMASASCSSSVAKFIAEAFDAAALKDFPNVDGVVPIVHGSGCGLADHGEGIEYLQRTLTGWARHPNFAGLLLVGHGCEINQIDDLSQKIDIDPCPTFQMFTVQDLGGTKKAIQRGIQAIKEMLPIANRVERQPVAAANLVVGLECGGSDAMSGITANPALGLASDLLVR